MTKGPLYKAAIVLAAGHTSAQVNVQEPEFVGNFCILTSDESFDALPKENGEIQKHQNKVSKFAKLVGGISRIAGAAGVLGVTTAGSATGVVNGIKVMSAAQGVASAADATNVLAGVEGMDIVFKGGSSHRELFCRNYKRASWICCLPAA